MSNLIPQIPMMVGSLAAMLVAFLSLMNGTTPATCLFKALTAFLVCAAFGLVARHALQSAELAEKVRSSHADRHLDIEIESIPLGMSVDDMLSDPANANIGEIADR